MSVNMFKKSEVKITNASYLRSISLVFKELQVKLRK